MILPRCVILTQFGNVSSLLRDVYLCSINGYAGTVLRTVGDTIRRTHADYKVFTTTKPLIGNATLQFNSAASKKEH